RKIWLLLAGMSVADLLWYQALGIGISHWGPLAALGAALLGIVTLGRRSFPGRPIIASAEWALLWIVFSVAGALLTYAAAAQGGALYDDRLAALDAALGFDWVRWSGLIAGYPLLQLGLTAIYQILFPQALFAA